MNSVPVIHEFDVTIVGAGPAGCSAAALLAEHGHRVALLEKQPFPRYRIGESLIPYCWFPLNRLGLVERLDEASFMVHKHSVQFVGMDGQQTTPFYFFKHTDHACARTWQVVRSEFDSFLLDHARSCGATFFAETSARSLVRDQDGVAGVLGSGADGSMTEFRSPLTIDASGRDMFAVGQNDWRVPDEDLQKIAIWSYYRGAKRDCGLDEGATTIAYLPDKGWFWHIPLPEDMVSVGVVAERDYLYSGERNPEAIMDREIATQPWVCDHVQNAQRTGPARVTGDYSFRSRHCAEDGLVLAGDAFAFLDPVFSSGVFLALQSGVLVADAAHAALQANDCRAGRFGEYGRQFCEGIEAMRRLVYAFYDTTFSFGAFLKAHPEHNTDLTDCLIGNVYKNLDPLFEQVGRYAQIPAPLPHGQPLVA